MAIVVEEEKSKSNIVSILMWLVIIGVVIYLAYYLFFAHPEKIDLNLPVSVSSTTELVNISISPDQVLGSDKFKALTPSEPASSTAMTGKTNPFMGF